MRLNATARMNGHPSLGGRVACTVTMRLSASRSDEALPADPVSATEVIRILGVLAHDARCSITDT